MLVQVAKSLGNQKWGMESVHRKCRSLGFTVTAKLPAYISNEISGMIGSGNSTDDGIPKSYHTY